jgi:hypothetical protein
MGIIGEADEKALKINKIPPLIPLCILAILLSTTCFSCRLFIIMADTFSYVDRDNDNDIEGNVQIYIDNKTSETLVVFSRGYKTGAPLASISPGTMQKINVSKGSRVYISGGNTDNLYREILCESDQETYTIY